MNIGDRVKVTLEMEVEGIKKSAFTPGLIIEGMIENARGQRNFVTVPESCCTIIQIPLAVPHAV